MLQNYVYLQKRGNIEISQKIATMEIQKFAQKKQQNVAQKSAVAKIEFIKYPQSMNDLIWCLFKYQSQ